MGLHFAHRLTTENTLATNRALVEFKTFHLVGLAAGFAGLHAALFD